MTKDEREEASFCFEAGVQCRREGRNREAISFFQRVVHLDPNNYPAWNNMGNAQNDVGNPNAAIQCWRSAVNVRPDYAIAWHNMGRAFLIRSRYENVSDITEAAACLQAAVTAQPDKQESWSLLGIAQNFLGNIDEAENCLLTAVRLKPGDAEAENFLAIVRKKKRNTEPTTGIQKGRIYSISLADGSAGLFKVLAVSTGSLEVLPVNAAEPSRFAGGARVVRAVAVVSFFESAGPWSAYAEGGHLEHLLGVEY
jgi:tetratricopeptide (TPR) repeat protein